MKKKDIIIIFLVSIIIILILYIYLDLSNKQSLNETAYDYNPIYSSSSNSSVEAQLKYKEEDDSLKIWCNYRVLEDIWKDLSVWNNPKESDIDLCPWKWKNLEDFFNFCISNFSKSFLDNKNLEKFIFDYLEYGDLINSIKKYWYEDICNNYDCWDSKDFLTSDIYLIKYYLWDININNLLQSYDLLIKDYLDTIDKDSLDLSDYLYLRFIYDNLSWEILNKQNYCWNLVSLKLK